MTMRARIFVAASATTIIAGIASAQSPTAQADVRLGPIANQYICTFDRSVAPGQVRSETARAIGRTMGEVLHHYRHSIRGFAVRLPAQPNGRSGVAELRANNPRIAGCEQDQRVRALKPPPGRGKPGGGGEDPPGPSQEETPWGVTRVGGPGTTSGNRAWVIDSGIDLDHPDLNVDSSLSVSFVGGGPDDKNGHGTHVAGTIAAIGGNNIGVVGVSPGTRVVAVRVLGANGSGSTSGVIAGVDHVAANAAAGDVANMSLGGGPSQALDNAVIAASAEKGTAFVLAAGNNGADADGYSPARAGGVSNSDRVFTVSAFAEGGAMAGFSNYGSAVEWAEPGVGVLSTYKGGGYATASGTSMAAPHLAGILVQGGVSQCGSVSGDPDGNPDPIGCH